MARRRSPQRISVESDWLGMPLVTTIGFDNIKEPITLEEHRHTGHELTYISEGQVKWLLEDGEELTLTGGNMAVVLAGTTHSGQWQVISPCRLFWIIVQPRADRADTLTTFTPEFLNAADAKLRESGNMLCRTDSAARGLFEQLLECLKAKHSDSDSEQNRALCRAVVCQLLTRVLALIEDDVEAPRQTLADRAQEIMAERLADDISVADLARETGMSTARFSDQFKRETGLTPADYLNRMRCAEARKRLANDNDTVTDIAFDLGFSSSQYFAKVFRKYTGMTPSAFRRR